MDKHYKIVTYGCQMNVHESEKIAFVLEKKGYKLCENEKDADIIVFNTCAIRENAEEHAFGNIGALKQIKRKKPELITAVFGCMTQQNGVAEKLHKTFPWVDIIFGTYNLDEFEELLNKKLEGAKSVVEVLDREKCVNENMQSYRTSYPNGWVNIMEGCDNFCTYCIVPYVKGRERSRLPENICSEVEELVKNGYKEITLLGQNVNSYGKDLSDKITFSELLERLCRIPGKFRLRFMTNHPKDFSYDLVKTMKKEDKICNCIHLPIQSGSNEVLKLMNRKYTREDYLEKLTYLKREIPDCAVTTDIMVGFPKETEEDFKDTLELVKQAEFSNAFTFIYSRRKGTVADKMDGQIDDETKKSRITRLIDAVSETARSLCKDYLGKTVEVLCEGYDEKKSKYLGRDEYGRMVYFSSDKDLTGEFVNVLIDKVGGISLYGELVN